MPAKVVDASAVAALLFNEPEAGRIAGRLGAEQLFAPTLFWFEMASVCLKKLTRHPQMRHAILQAYGLLGRVGVEPVEVDHQALVSLAEGAGVTVYDASYLWLAQNLSAELITLDKRLSKAAARLPR